MKGILAHNENNSNNYNVISDSESDNEVEENVFEEQLEDELKVNPKNTLNPTVVFAMTNLHASYNEDAKSNKEQAAQEKLGKIIKFF